MQQVALAFGGFASAMFAFALNVHRHIDVRLIAESSAPRPGHTQFVGLQMTPQPGWHGYWSNPGEAGLAPSVKWAAPAGVRFGPLQHPAPTLLKVQGLTSFVHAGPHVLISRMTLGRNLQPGTTLPIAANVSWAACSDKLCVPERATLTLQMTVGDGTPSVDAPIIRRAVAAEPKIVSSGVFQFKGGKLVLQLPPSAELYGRRVRFFPDENGFFDAARARVISASPLRIEAPAKDGVPVRFSGVASGGSAAFRLSFERGELPGPQTETIQPSRVPDLSSPRPTHEVIPAPAVHPSSKQHPTPPAWARRAELGLVVLGMFAAAILIAQRRRQGRA